MNRRALLGLFTLLGFAALIGVYFVLSDFASKATGYRIGIRFPSAAALNPGALVYESGVVVGSVDTVALLPDYTSEVVVALKNNVSVPSNARFLIVQPLTGDSSLRIILTRHGRPIVPASPLPRRVLPVAEQPLGQATQSLAEFLADSQDQFARIDALLAQFQQRGPRLMEALEQTLVSAHRLTADADASLTRLSTDADRSLVELTGSSRQLTAQLSQSLALASSNIVDLTNRLDASARRGQPHLDDAVVQLDSASKQLSQSMNALHGIAADPALRENVVATTRSLAATAATFSSLLGDLRTVTGDPRTQAQLRDALAHVDSASQKADSLLGALGGRSDVGGVDRPQAPLPQGSPLPLASPFATTPPTVPGGSSSPPPMPTPLPTVKAVLRPTTALRSLVGVDIRMGELSPMHRDTSGAPLTSPLLTQDRGPQTDVTLVGLPRGTTNILLGANDVGANTTVTAAVRKRDGIFTYGGGILYSRLGILAGVDGRFAGLETRIYDPRRGSVDVYGRLFANPDHSLSIFAGQRDATRATRRNVFGVEAGF